VHVHVHVMHACTCKRHLHPHAMYCIKKLMSQNLNATLTCKILLELLYSHIIVRVS
jgi:hypothetical protein